MSNNIENGGPAFPIDIGDGMSLRDWFAGLAMSGLCANPNYDGTHNSAADYSDYSDYSYRMADAMLAERKK